MRKRRREPDEIRIPDSSTSCDHGKRFGDQREPEHPGFPGGAESDKDRDQRSSTGNFQSKSSFGAHSKLPRQRTPPRKIRRLPSGLEERVREITRRRKNAGGRAEFITPISAISRQLSAKTAAQWN